VAPAARWSTPSPTSALRIRTEPHRAAVAAPVASSPVIPDRLRPVLERTTPLAERFAASGHRIYLVGGVVRDLLLGRDMSTGRDIDLTTDAHPEETKRLVKGWADSVWTQGERFGTIGCRKDGWDFEITTHRAEAYDPDSRKPVVEFSDAVEADLSRRDFTVNAMALALPEPTLIDPFGGADDLAAGRLRTPLSPEVSFSDDPLRMLRAARFVAGYGLEPVPELTAAVEAMADRIEIVSAERIRDEFDKLIVVDDPSAGLWFLADTGLIDRFLPEFAKMRLEQDPIHRHKDVLTHTIAVVAKTRPDRLVRLGALYHDVGKPRTRSIGDGGVSFHHHEVVGARMTRERMKALKYSTDDIEAVSRLVFLHLRFHTYKMGWTDSAVRRFVRDADDLLPELIELTRCDCTTRNEKKARALSRRMDELEERIAELQAREELKSIRPDLDGNQVMAHLGLGPGRDVGQALDFLLELRLEEGPLGPDEAYRRLDAWWAERQADAGTTA
jgi:poly(A) polymerase